MKCKLLAIIMAVTMVITMLPISVAAESNKAKVNDTEFPTFAEAIDYVSDAGREAGDYTVTILADCADNVKLIQRSGVNVTITAVPGVKFAGQIIIDGNTRNTGSETVTIKGITFDRTTSDDASAMINTDGYTFNRNNDYAHNITIDECAFIDDDQTVTALDMRKDYKVTITNCTAEGLKEFISAFTVNAPFEVRGIEIKDCIRGFTLEGYATNVQMSDVTIEAEEFGIILNPQTATVSGGNITGATIIAKYPIAIGVPLRKDQSITDPDATGTLDRNNASLSINIENCKLQYTDGGESKGIVYADFVGDSEFISIATDALITAVAPNYSGVVTENVIEEEYVVPEEPATEEPTSFNLLAYILLKRFMADYAITVETEGDGEVISNDEDNLVRFSKSITFTAVAGEGSELTSILLDGEEVELPAENEYTIEKVKKAHTITFIFSEVK